jgi:hypothetical protein
MSENRARNVKRENLEAILAELRRGVISSSEAAKKMAIAGASMAVIGRLLQPKAATKGHKGSWTQDGWVG